MADLVEQIKEMISDSARDLDQIERTLTDGYARALNLEAEKWRVEKRIAEVAEGLQRGDMAKKARELASLAKERDEHDEDLAALRGLLGELRRHADGVRIGSPLR